MQTKIFYNVQNGGDGSAYPHFFSSDELACWDEDQMSEGWGECCVGSILISSDGPIECSEVVCPLGYFAGFVVDQRGSDDQIREFVAAFFPAGLPEFSAQIVDPDDDYTYSLVFVAKRLVARVFTRQDRAGAVLAANLNAFRIDPATPPPPS